MTISMYDLYGGTTATKAGSIAPTEAASGGEETGAAGNLPAIWLVGLVLALVLVRVMYEVA